MADYTSDRTGANIDAVLDRVDSSGIGTASNISSDLNSDSANVFVGISTSTANAPSSGDGVCVVGSGAGSRNMQLCYTKNTTNLSFRGRSGASWQPWKELYHTGNTGALVFSSGPLAAGVEAVQVEVSTGAVNSYRNDVTNAAHFRMYNNNGEVGSIKSTGTATTYNTSSDPRLKDFKAAPTDAEVNAKFDDLFGCFKTFNWKNDPTGDLVWGFDAHATIDAGLDMGSEGEGSRDLALGDVYDTTPAELDEDGVETKAAIEHKVSPAGVD